MENQDIYAALPPVRPEMQLDTPHFPTRLHAAIFRLWETVSAEQIARGLGIPLPRILQIAEDMGLPAQRYTDIWAKRGYITTIRNVWHILPYDQLLGVLGWDAARLALCLKEDDFLVHKLGNFKPYCEPVCDVALNDEQKAQCSAIKNTMQTAFSDVFDGAAPFSYFDTPIAGRSTPAPQFDGLRMVYSFCGLYANVLDEDIEESYPEELLKRYREVGVNAIWLQGILYQLTPFTFDESYSVGWEKRQERLRQLVTLADKYGIKVFLYLNEPRCMPNSFFEKHPELCGAKKESYSALCTSVPAVLEHLRSSVQNLCGNVKGLGGFFLINMSENLTHCKSLPNSTECERCRKVSGPKLVSEVIKAIVEPAKAEDPNIRIVAWTWAWDKMMTEEELTETLSLLPKDVIVQSNSEASKPYCIGGVSGTVADYSMSVIGPSEVAKNIWHLAKENGNEICAKVQVNNTWECSTMPYLPVFDLVREHMINLKKENVKNVMLSWTLGGYPGVNLKIAGKCFEDDSEVAYDALLREEFGEYAPTVKKAAAVFSEAFREFPFQIRVVYNGPQNGGPSNPLYLKPTGFRATMTCYPYDDLDGWRAIYPREVFREQLKKLSEKWEKGLSLLDGMPNCEFKQMAYGGYLLFASSYLQTDFVMQRDAGNMAALGNIAEKEKKNAHMMYKLMLDNPAVGYEAANHYYFNKMMLAEKYISCEHIKKTLSN